MIQVNLISVCVYVCIFNPYIMIFWHLKNIFPAGEKLPFPELARLAHSQRLQRAQGPARNIPLQTDQSWARPRAQDPCTPRSLHHQGLGTRQLGTTAQIIQICHIQPIPSTQAWPLPFSQKPQQRLGPHALPLFLSLPPDHPSVFFPAGSCVVCHASCLQHLWVSYTVVFPELFLYLLLQPQLTEPLRKEYTDWVLSDSLTNTIKPSVVMFKWILFN